MAKNGFPRCNEFTRKEEGGYANHPSDPGGKTMNGVTEATFHKWLVAQNKPIRAVRTITEKETDAIYKSGYWDTVNAEDLFEGVDLAVYDYAVNSGPSRARKALLSVVGSEDNSITVKRLCAQRQGFVNGLSTFKTFGKGWTARIARVEATGVKWVLAAQGLDPLATYREMNKEKDAASTTSKTQAGVGAGSTVAGTATSTAPTAPSAAPNTPDVTSLPPSTLIYAIVGICALAAAYLFWRAFVNHKRAEAYQNVVNQGT